MISSEEEEVLGICDRIFVMNKGKIIKVLEAKQTTVSEIKGYVIQ